MLLIAVALLCAVAFAQNCNPVDFGKGSVVCECNATFCDFYPDPKPPNKTDYIWYVSSKNGSRLMRTDGKIANQIADGIIVKVNSTKQYQTMEGFGGAFTDAAGINIKKLSQGAQDNLMKSYFSVNGSNYNFGRLPVGGCDFSIRAYTYDDVRGDTELQNFTLAEEDFEYKIPLMKKALELNPSIRFVSAAWTAPPWMKSRNLFNGFTYLLEKHYQTYANYLVKFLEEYKKNGLEMWAISTGNEPFTTLVPISHINSMFWSSGTVSKWIINNFGPALQKSTSNNTYMLLLDDQRIALPWYVADIKKHHRDVLQYVQGVGVHWYTDAFVPPNVLDVTHALVPDKFILITESSVGDRPWDNPKVILGSWSRAEMLIEKMFENFNHWVVGWIDWNLALNSQGGPNWVKNYVDAPIIVLEDKDIFYKQPLFYAMAHFSKFVPPSSIRIDSMSTDKNILTTAFQTKNNQTVVLLYNKSYQKRNISLIDEKIGYINVELPEYSLHTIIYNSE